MTADDQLQRLRLVGSAIAGRPLAVAAVAPGEPAWTDGTTVHLDPSADRSHQLRALAVQASLLAAGSFDGDILARLRSRRALARRYLAVEGHRALAANLALLPPAVRPLVDHGIADSVDSAHASLALAQGRGVVPDAPVSFGRLRPREVMAATERSAAGEEGMATTGARPPASLPDLDGSADEDDHDEGGHLGQLLSSPVGGGGPIGRLLKRLLSSSRQRGEGGPPGADAASHLERGWSARPGVVVSTRTSAPTIDEPAGRGRTGYTYPEWDLHRSRYRADWCTVAESDPAADDLRSMPMPDGVAFRRPLARLGTGLTPCRRRPQGDDIDLDAAVEARVDALAGSPIDERLYVETLRQRRDLSVLVLLDVSGSANEPGPGGRPVHEHQREVAAALTVALHDLGDRVALYAFNSHGRSSVRVQRVKRFDDRLDGLAVRRLGSLVPAAYTRLGAAIRHGTTIVEHHGGTSQRLLVVLSDGFAYDHGYEGRYGEADARRALLEARRRGVGCLCLSVGAGVDAAALRRVFGTAAHVAVPSSEHLVPLIGPLFRASLLSAESARRVFQRRARTSERLELEGSAA